jgi:hypothetical protein
MGGTKTDEKGKVKLKEASFSLAMDGDQGRCEELP